jgi:hypothetical protein
MSIQSLKLSVQQYAIDIFSLINQINNVCSVVFKIQHNDGNMARKGVWRTSLSRCNEIDACDELAIPLKPFLAIFQMCALHEQERTRVVSSRKS